MKVLHIITTIDRGGAENQLVILLREQVKLHDVTVLPLIGSLELLEEMTKLGVKVLSQFANRKFVAQITGIRFYLKVHPYDLIHAHLPRSEILASLVVSTQKLISTRHNAETFWPNHPGRISRILAKIATRRAIKVICISKTVADFVSRYEEVSCINKLEVVHYGFEISSNSITLRPGKKTSLRIVNVARHVAQKDIYTLLNGFYLFLSYSPESTLTLVGHGVESEKIKSEIERLGIEASVDIIEKEADVVQLLKKFDVFALTSLYEGFGMVYFEATVSGLPILSSRHETSIELLGIEYQGLFKTGASPDLCKLLIRCLNNRFCFNLIADATFKLQRFSVSEMNQKFEKIYTEAINS